MRTGVIGLGAMGAPMARNLHGAGHLVAVWNRTASRAETLAHETGAAIAADPADLVRRCELVIISVSADADLLEIVDQLVGGVSEDTMVVDTSTVAASTAVEAARRVAGAGGAFLDAPVSGGVEGARNGSLAMMVGGDEQVVEQVRPVLEALARRIVHMGSSGSGQATKAVNQVIAAGVNQAVTEGLAFGRALGLDPDRVVEVVGSGAASSWFLSHRGPTMTQGHFAPGFKVVLHHKDLSICKQMAAERETQLPVVEMTLIHYQRLIEAGYGDEDISALYRVKQGLFEDNEFTGGERNPGARSSR